MKFIIQKGDFFSEHNYQVMLDTLQKLGVDYDVVEILPFTNTLVNRFGDEVISYDTEEKNVFCLGSVKMAVIGKDWYPGSFYNDNHDYLVYSRDYKDNLLNYDGKILKLGDRLPELPTLFFARPCKDLKLFTGGIFMEHSYYELVEHLIKNGASHEELVLVSTPKNIDFEVRCWVVKGKVITMSEYKRDGRVRYRNVDDNLDLKNKVQEFINIYQPAEAFVIDICQSEGKIKIVEINCINCSGFYEGDMSKLIKSIIYNF